MGGPEGHLVQVGIGVQVDPTRLHEPEGPVDLGGDGFIAPALQRRRHELLVPGVDLGEVGEAALGEGPQQVHRGRRLVIGGHEPVGVGNTTRG